MKYHSQSHWLNWKGMSSAAKPPPPYLFLDFQFAAQEFLAGVFLIRILGALNPAGFNRSTQNS